MEYKTFDELEFKEHPHYEGAARAKMKFENGYRIQVILYAGLRMRAGLIYDSRFTIAAIKGDICEAVRSGISQSSFASWSNCKSDQITEIMRTVQEYPADRTTGAPETVHFMEGWEG